MQRSTNLGTLRRAYRGLVSLAAGILVLGIPSLVWAQSKIEKEITTQHFRIQTGEKSISGIEEILEQLFVRLVGLFQSEPSNPISVMIFDTQEEFQSELHRNGLRSHHQEASGLYSHRTETAYVWAKSEEAKTRRTLLHEVTHAFHGAITASGRIPADWYIEGLADYFSIHCWDGAVLKAGICPVISRDDWAAEALTSLDQRNWEVKSIIFRAHGYERAESWAMVHLLVAHYPEKLRKLGFTLKSPAEAWAAVFGTVSGDFIDAFRNHLLEIQQPWSVVSGVWQECEGVIQGSSDGIGLALLKETPQVFSVEIDPRIGSGRSGLIAASRYPDDYHQLVWNQAGLLRLEHIEFDRRTEGEFLRDRFGKPIESTALTIVSRGSTRELFAECKRVAALPTQGQVGIVVLSGAKEFSVRRP